MADTRTSSLVAPQGRWWTPLGRDEKLWFVMAIVWSLMMFIMIFFIWPAIGNEQPDFRSYRLEESEFASRTQAFIDANQSGESIGGIPVVAPEPETDIFLLSTRFQFRPILQLQVGETYRILLSSNDVQHGFSLQPDGFNLQVLPGYITEFDLTPEEPGEFQIVCNEYCGTGHHIMLGRIIVVE